MKKLMCLTLVALLLVACKPWWNVEDTYDPQFDFTWAPQQTVDGVLNEVGKAVDYLDDDVHDVSEYWQNPYQTWSWGRGDCEDFAILAMYMIRQDLGGWPEMVIGNSHAWIAYEGAWYEPQTGQVVTDDPWYVESYRVSYGVAMWRSMNGHKEVNP